jgi:hypothetical protein
MEDPSKTPTWFIENYPPLSSQDDVGRAAVEGQFVNYPQVVRTMTDPPIHGQTIGNLSFMLFKTPRMFRNKPIYGYVKLRGNHLDEKSARYDAYRIIREVDSKFQVRCAKIGTWVPITDDDSCIKDLYDVRENDEEKHIRDEAVKEREAEARRIAKEIKEAEDALKNGSDIYDNPESLDFYTMKRVTEMRLTEAYQIAMRKLKELENSMIETHITLRTLEINQPDYSQQWIDVYNRERSKTSLPNFIPSEKQFEQYESTSLAELTEKYPELFEKVKKQMSTYGK